MPLFLRYIAILILAFMLAMPVAVFAQQDMKFAGSRKSDKYHYLDCRWAKKIHLGNVIYFDSVEEARKAGYVPCKVCRPPGK